MLPLKGFKCWSRIWFSKFWIWRNGSQVVKLSLDYETFDLKMGMEDISRHHYVPRKTWNKTSHVQYLVIHVSLQSEKGMTDKPATLVSFPSFSLFPTPVDRVSPNRCLKARHEADSFEPAEWSERLPSRRSGWLGAAAAGSIPALSTFFSSLSLLSKPAKKIMK